MPGEDEYPGIGVLLCLAATTAFACHGGPPSRVEKVSAFRARSLPWHFNADVCDRASWLSPSNKGATQWGASQTLKPSLIVSVR